MHTRKLFTSVSFFILGITLFWIVYRNFDFSILGDALKTLKYEWILISISFGLLSHFIRAVRWKMLINTMGYKPNTTILFISVIILYFINVIVPRGGEVARCAVISKYEKIPFIKLVGTVFIERITDLVTFILILLILIIWQYGFFKTIMSYPGFQLNFSSFNSKLLLLVIVLIIISILIVVSVKLNLSNRIFVKLKQFKIEFIKGLSVILHLEKKIKFISYTILIFILCLFMLYAVFFAYGPTNKLSFITALLTYSFGTLAYLLPIQAGIGAWHFIVVSCLFFFGVDKESSMIFALIAHTCTNLIFILLGPISMAFLPFIKNKKVDFKEIYRKA